MGVPFITHNFLNKKCIPDVFESLLSFIFILLTRFKGMWSEKG